MSWLLVLATLFWFVILVVVLFCVLSLCGIISEGIVLGLSKMKDFMGLIMFKNRRGSLMMGVRFYWCPCGCGKCVKYVSGKGYFCVRCFKWFEKEDLRD